jgi:hypothetical protein
MNQSKRSIMNLTKRDVGLVLGIGTLAAILNVCPYPLVTAGAVVIGILLLRLTESRNENTEQGSVQESQTEQTVEQRSAQEIITDKLNGGVIEKAIDERFEKMVAKIIDDLFGSHGDITREIQKRLRETMSPYLEQFDFSKYNTKLEHLLNELVANISNDQQRIIKNVKEIMGVEPVKEIKTTELFDKYAAFISKTIDTDKLEINTDDTPSYESLHAHMLITKDLHHSSMSEKQFIKFSCEEDEDLNITVTIRRWKDSVLGNDWRIEGIKRTVSDGETIYAFQTQRGDKDITSLELPMNHLRDLTDLEVYLLKLHYDNAAIIIDETEISDDDVEVDAVPEYSLS